MGDDPSVVGPTELSVTQFIQFFQKEAPGDTGTPPPGPGGAKTTAPTRDDPRFAAGRDVMLRFVARVRRTDGTFPRWRLPFELARVIRRLPYPPGGVVYWEPLAVEFAGLTGLDPEAVVGDFGHALVATVTGDRFEAAVKLALRGPVAMDPDPGVAYATEARVCYYLSEMAGGGPFPLPVERLGEAMGKTRMSGSRAVRHLIDAGVIRPTRSADHIHGVAREVQFLAAVPWWA